MIAKDVADPWIRISDVELDKIFMSSLILISEVEKHSEKMYKIHMYIKKEKRKNKGIYNQSINSKNKKNKKHFTLIKIVLA